MFLMNNMAQSSRIAKEFGNLLVGNKKVVQTDSQEHLKILNENDFDLSADGLAVGDPALTIAGSLVVRKRMAVESVAHFNSIDMQNTRIINVAPPIQPQDAVNLSYFEARSGGVTSGQGIYKIDDQINVSSNLPFVVGLGTISSGEWRATPISLAYGGTGLTSVIPGRVLITGDTSLTTDPGLLYSAITKTLNLTRLNESMSSSSGTLVVSGGVGIGKALNIGGTLCVSGPATVQGLFTARSGLQLTGNLTIAGSAGFGSNVSVGGNATVFGLQADSVTAQTADFGTVTADTLTVQFGPVQVPNLTVTQDITCGGSATLVGSLSVNGPVTARQATFANQVQMGSTLAVAGASTLSQTSVQGNLSVSGGTTSSSLTTGSVSAGSLAVTSTTDASVTLSGGLQVARGISVSGAVTALSGMSVFGDTAVGGNVTATGNLTVNGTVSSGTLSAPGVTVSGTADSVSATSRAVTVAGGVGIAKNLSIGGTLSCNNLVFFNVTTESTTPSSGALIVAGGVGIAKTLNVQQNLNVSGSTAVTGNLTWGGTALAYNTVDSVSVSTGSLVLAGGIGIAKNATVGQTLTAANGVLTGLSTNTANVSGNTSIGGSLTVSGVYQNGENHQNSGVDFGPKTGS
ncbi:hypothetical protein HK102_003849 [Quaeritorhiza haematococci]|nr:hypothetical protein HK102_003849 [Quaeritorhiza haematococci]